MKLFNRNAPVRFTLEQARTDAAAALVAVSTVVNEASDRNPQRVRGARLAVMMTLAAHHERWDVQGRALAMLVGVVRPPQPDHLDDWAAYMTEMTRAARSFVEAVRKGEAGNGLFATAGPLADTRVSLTPWIDALAVFDRSDEQTLVAELFGQATQFDEAVSGPGGS